MDGPVADIQVFDGTGYHFVKDYEVVGSKIGSQFRGFSVEKLDAHLEVPPFEPWPSQYAWPFPSMMCPVAPVMVISVPAISIGLKVELFVVPKVLRRVLADSFQFS